MAPPRRQEPRRLVLVVSAYILLNTEVGKARDVAQECTGIEGVLKADATSGPYDVVVLAQARSVDELGQIVLAKIQLVDGITRTLTCPLLQV
jgi:DNA-binding Lrp family transcriptional regulator